MKKNFNIFYLALSLIASIFQFLVFTTNSNKISFQNQYTFSSFQSLISPFSYIFFLKINTILYQNVKKNYTDILNALFFSFLLIFIIFILFLLILTPFSNYLVVTLLYIIIAIFDLASTRFILQQKVYLIGVFKLIQSVFFFIFMFSNLFYMHNNSLIEAFFYSYLITMSIFLFFNYNIRHFLRNVFINISFKKFINFIFLNYHTVLHSLFLMLFNTVPFILIFTIQNEFGVNKSSQFAHLKQNLILPTTTLVPIISNLLINKLLKLQNSLYLNFKKYLFYLIFSSVILYFILYYGVDYLYLFYYDSKWHDILKFKNLLIPIILYHFICLPFFGFYYKLGDYAKLNKFLFLYFILNLTLLFLTKINFITYLYFYLLLETIYFFIFLSFSFFYFKNASKQEISIN